MRISLAVCLLLILFGFTALNETQQKNLCHWGYPYVRSDSTGTIAHGIDTQTDCFPGFMEQKNSFSFIKVLLLNRWGQTVFETNDSSENWICNSTGVDEDLKGVYFGYYIFEDSTARIDTSRLQVRIF